MYPLNKAVKNFSVLQALYELYHSNCVFKVTKADYFAVFGKDIDYYEKLLTTGQGKYMIIERLWYELAKKDKLRIYSFKCYPDLSGNRGSVNMAYDKNKVSLFFRNILCKFGYYSMK